MVLSLWDIARNIFTVATAAIAPVLPIPQGADYFAETAYHLSANAFSTDPTAKGMVLAETNTADGVQAFIFNDDRCPNVGDSLFYRLYLGNKGNAPIRDIVIQYQYPDNTQFSSASPQPLRVDQDRRLIVWRLEGLAPLNGYAQFSVTVTVTAKGAKTSSLSAEYTSSISGISRVVTSHTVPDDCGGGNSPTKPRPQGKVPAIICDPAETSCTQSIPQLGPRFQAGKPAIGALELGPRFQEAVSNIIPGECRVAADDIIIERRFNDALNRKFDPAAFYMDPLYQSGQDYKQMNHENSLLAIPFFADIQEKLAKIHTKYWQNQSKVLQGVLDKKTKTSDVRPLIDSWYNDWVRETTQAQQGFAIRYGQLQQQRKTKFDPVAQKAVTNARTSMQRACNTQSDGGISALLPIAKKAFEDNLTDRQRIFSNMQTIFADGNSPVFRDKVRAAQWQQDLRNALDAFDKGNPKPLEVYVSEIGLKDTQGFGEAFRLTYTKHQREDLDADERVRTNAFNTVLNEPKKKATDCEKEKVFKQKVEVTFCESHQGIPSVLSTEANAIKNSRPNAVPFDPVAPGNSVINPNAVKGQACSGRPGDPWWSNGCECGCNEVVPGVIDANGNPVVCQAIYPIVRHDVYASKAECLAELKEHSDLYF